MPPTIASAGVATISKIKIAKTVVTCTSPLSITASVPNPKFAILCSALRANFGFDKDTSKPMILVSFMDQKFARWTRGNDGANF